MFVLPEDGYYGENISASTAAELERRSRPSPYVAQKKLVPIRDIKNRKSVLGLADKISEERKFELKVMAEMFWETGAMSAVSGPLPKQTNLGVPSVSTILHNREVYEQETGRSSDDA